MNLTEQGGTAFPADVHTHTESGMSLRDYFAAMAMQGLLSDFGTRPSSFKSKEEFREHVARSSYEYADAMLKARRPHP